MEGTLNGKRGMFPDNFVRALKKQQPPPPPPMKAKKEAKQLHMALFDYEAANADEISFKGPVFEFHLVLLFSTFNQNPTKQKVK